MNPLKLVTNTLIIVSTLSASLVFAKVVRAPILTISDIQNEVKNGKLKTVNDLLTALPEKAKDGVSFLFAGEGLIQAKALTPNMVIAVSPINLPLEISRYDSISEAKNLSLMLLAFNPRLLSTQKVIDILEWSPVQQKVQLGQIHFSDRQRIESIEMNPQRCLSCHGDSSGRIRPIWSSYGIFLSGINNNPLSWVGSYDEGSNSRAHGDSFSQFRNTLKKEQNFIANWVNGLDEVTIPGSHNGTLTSNNSFYVANSVGVINALSLYQWLLATLNSISNFNDQQEIKKKLNQAVDSCRNSSYSLPSAVCRNFLISNPDFVSACDSVNQVRLEHLQNTALKGASLIESSLSPYVEDAQMAKVLRKNANYFALQNDIEDERYTLAVFNSNPRFLFCTLHWLDQKVNPFETKLSPSLIEGFYFNNGNYQSWVKILYDGILELAAE